MRVANLIPYLKLRSKSEANPNSTHDNTKKKTPTVGSLWFQLLALYYICSAFDIRNTNAIELSFFLSKLDYSLSFLIGKSRL